MSKITIEFPRATFFTEGVGPNGVTITHDRGGTFVFSATGATGSGTTIVTYDGAWDIPPIKYDVLNYQYVELNGDYRDVNDLPMLDRSFTIINCDNPLQFDGSAPRWISQPVINLVVGQSFDIDLSDFVDHTNNIEANNIYRLKSDPSTIPIGSSVTSPGRYTGTVGALQGGTYGPVFEVENTQGVTSDLFTIIVSLGEDGPVLANPPDLSSLEEGSLVSFFLSDGVTNTEGNPLSYALHGTSDLLPSDAFLDAITSKVSGIIASGQDGTYNMKYIVTDTVTGLINTVLATQTLTVGAVTSDNPLALNVYSGNAGCASSVPPTWRLLTGGGDGVFNIDISDVNEKNIDLITLYMDSDGGSSIDDIRIFNNVVLPNDFDLIDALADAKFGFITGNNNGNIVSTPTFQVEIHNTAGWSLPSPVLTWNFTDANTVTPDIVSIDAIEGTNDVNVRFKEAVLTPTGTAASYELGHAFKVNNASRSRIYKSGGATSVLVFTLGGEVLTGNNTITHTYTT